MLVEPGPGRAFALVAVPLRHRRAEKIPGGAGDVRRLHQVQEHQVGHFQQVAPLVAGVSAAVNPNLTKMLRKFHQFGQEQVIKHLTADRANFIF